MTHGLGIHIIQFPSGKWGFVGTIPSDLLGWREPTVSDVMGGRVHNGKAHYSLTFDTRVQAAQFAVQRGYLSFQMDAHEQEHVFAPSSENRLYCEHCGASETLHRL